MKRAIDLEKRARIAEAYENDPSLTYLALQQRFKTSTRVVADALRRLSREWKALLQDDAVLASREVKFMGITVWGRVHGGDVDYETQEQGCADWEAIESATLAELLESFVYQGWEPVNVATIQHGALPFSGIYEILLRKFNDFS